MYAFDTSAREKAPVHPAPSFFLWPEFVRFGKAERLQAPMHSLAEVDNSGPAIQLPSGLVGDEQEPLPAFTLARLIPDKVRPQVVRATRPQSICPKLGA
jgi:hypothetical protein